MSRIAVIGGTGYAGRNIVAEARARGHEVLSVARSAQDAPAGVTAVRGSILDAQGIAAAIDPVDVVVFATAPRGEMAGVTRRAVADVIAALPENVRVGVVGGAGGSLVAPGGSRLVDAPGFPEEFRTEALEVSGILEDLRAGGPAHDWFYIHPAAAFGPWNDHDRRGEYRDGGDVLVTDAAGRSEIGGADFAIAVLDEIENPRHRGERFTVGY